MSHFGDHLGLPEALLEPSWAKKYCLTPRGPPVQAQGRVGGGVTPSPKGKKEAGRGNSLLHLRPKGLVGLSPSSAGKWHRCCPSLFWVKVPARRPTRRGDPRQCDMDFCWEFSPGYRQRSSCVNSTKSDLFLAKSWEERLSSGPSSSSTTSSSSSTNMAASPGPAKGDEDLFATPLKLKPVKRG